MNLRMAVVAVAALLLLGGCSSGNTASNPTGSMAATKAPTFVLNEFKIAVDGPIPAGQVDAKIDNQGDETHEVVIVAAKDASALATKADGSVDEDKIPEADKLGESGDVPAHESTTKRFTFVPGTYVAFCNIVDDTAMTGTTMMGGNGGVPMSGGPMGNGSNGTMMGGSSTGGMGHVHFARGMHTTFTVT